MAPKKKTILCQICEDAPMKYKCSKCMVVYCSVPCYKKHKEESCTHLVPSSAPTYSADGPAPTPSAPSTSTLPSKPTSDSIPTPSLAEDDDITDDTASSSTLPKPTPPSIRALSTLLWPTESEDANMADGAGDPLEKYEPKPLRREELMAIATSPELRVILADPLLPPLLEKINAIPPSSRSHHHYNPSPLSSRDAFLKAALGVAPPSVTGAHPSNSRGRGARGRGRGGRGGGHGGPHRGGEDGLGMTDEELLSFRAFAACVEKVLKNLRVKEDHERRGLDWEDGLGL